MNITFRTDASLQIGTGHVMRCLTLADVLQAAGAECHFICRDHPGNLITQIRQRGFTARVLPAPALVSDTKEPSVAMQEDDTSWLGVEWETDAVQTNICIGATQVDWLIVDHYTLDARWEKAARPQCRKLMVIDDLVNRPHDCDLLLDQSLSRDANDYSRLVPDGCTVLAGAHYALLRPGFAALREDSLRRRTKPQLKHLLITMGGVDQTDATGKVLEALLECSLPADMRITVLMGPHAPWLERVQSLARQMQQATEVKVNVNNIAELMADSDFSIGAAGTTSWERCCMGLPTLIVVLAENQRNVGAALEQSGSTLLLDGVEAIPHALPSILRMLVTTDALNQLSQKSRLVTDGQGASRVLNAMSERHG